MMNMMLKGVCVLLGALVIAGRETGNNGILKMLALPVSRCTLSIAKSCVILFISTKGTSNSFATLRGESKYFP